MWWWSSNNLLFFAHKESIRLACWYRHVVLMDCTYKTNKYRLPLLHIGGMTSFNSQFSVDFCFLKEEKQNNYMWGLSKFAAILTPETRPAVIVTNRELSLMAAIDKIFPSSSHMLCTWHINIKPSRPNANDVLRRASNGTCFFSSRIIWWLLTRKWNLKNSGKSYQTLLTVSIKLSNTSLIRGLYTRIAL